MIGKKQYFHINNATWDNEKFDFFIYVCGNRRADTHFIIPSSIMPKAAVSLLTKATPDQSKYAQFKEAWHLLAREHSGVAQQNH